MSILPEARVSAACFHASMCSALYILVRELKGMPWFFQLDWTICLVSAISIVFFWMFGYRVVNRDSGGFTAAAFSLIITSSAALLSIMLYAWSKLEGRPLGVPGMGILIVIEALLYLVAYARSILTFAIAVFTAGLVTNLIFSLRSWNPRLLSSTGFVLTGLCLTVPVGAAYSGAAYGVGFVKLATEYRELQAFSVKVRVSLVVGDRPVVLERTIQCRRPTTRGDRSIAARVGISKPYWLPASKSFGQTLDDGSGVFVITPNICGTLAADNPGHDYLPLTTNLLPSNFTPLIGWTPDAQTLKSFDLYIAKSAFEKPGSKIVFESIQMFRANEETQIDPLDEFASIGWFGGRTEANEYGGYFVNVIPSEIRRANKVAANELTKVEVFGFVFTSDEWRRKSPYRKPVPYIARNGESLPQLPSSPGWHRGPPTEMVPIKGAVLPLRRKGEGWELDRENAGILTFYKGMRTTGGFRLPPPDNISIGSLNAFRPPKLRSGFVYDPRQDTLYSIDTAHFFIANPESVLASTTSGSSR